ncbi:hypothetical protein [Amycolatopsis sp. NPDC004378]
MSSNIDGRRAGGPSPLPLAGSTSIVSGGIALFEPDAYRVSGRLRQSVYDWLAAVGCRARRAP